jgi:hypothetical protein
MNYRILSLSSGFFAVIFFSLFLGSFITTNYDLENSLNRHKNSNNEIYDPVIGSINSLDELDINVRNAVRRENLSGIQIPIFIDDLLRKKFMHGSSSIDTKGNWVLQSADFLFPKMELTHSYSPTDIALHNRGICSQQAILFQELVSNYGFEYESVGFNIPLLEFDAMDGDQEFNHYASAVQVDDKWYYFDSNLEPAYDRNNAKVYSEILIGKVDRLTALYPAYKWAEITEGMVYSSSRNIFPAKNGLLFQKISKGLSFFSWIIFCIFSIIFWRLSRVNL